MKQIMTSKYMQKIVLAGGIILVTTFTVRAYAVAAGWM